MIIEEGAYLSHYGILRKSGRYPWGSGGTQSQRNRSFLDTIAQMKKDGMSDTDICKSFSTKEHPFTTTDLRAAKTIAINEQKQSQINRAQRLKENGLSNVAIGQAMGINESSVRSLLAPGQKVKADILTETSEMLRREVAEKKYLDIGTGTELDLPMGESGARIGLSPERFKTAVALLKEEGYQVQYVKVPQLGTSNMTSHKVLVAPGTPYKETFQNRDKIRAINESTYDGGRSFLGIQKPLDIPQSRVGIRYKEDGGTDADGVIYVRPGVKDVSIGDSRYAQVRVSVDGSHYLKGMAIYKDDLPDGVDLLFNTNKSNTGNKLDALKKQKDDPDNPFGAVIRQLRNDDGSLRSAMNIVGSESKEGSGVEGAWGEWSKSLSSQVLSKQSPTLAKSQLNMTYEQKRKEFDEIMALTNPSVKKKLLESFADDTDSSAVHMKAAALPRQATHVILPVPTMPRNQVYAPNYENGERVALIRYPHAGTFEIPELVVNNNHKPAIKLLGRAKDAIGIHPDVAERLSGADFDGDTVLVIPNNKGSIKSTPPLEQLKNFDPKSAYPKYPGMVPIDAVKGRDQQEMGYVTNLISDMTIKGASSSEIARAVKHSMVVIDAKKHELDYKSSYRDNGIAALMKTYQGRSQGGASTLITRATARQDVNKRKLRPAAEGGGIDRETGAKVYVDTNESFIGRDGKTVIKRERSSKLAETPDALTLSSGTTIEKIYGTHSNRLKALANEARKATLDVKPPKKSPSAAVTYAPQVAAMNAKLNVALKNAPLERQAQVQANGVVRAKREANPDMELSELKKVKAQALAEARTRVGAKKVRIDLTQDEWDAIQAGAIAPTKLNRILANTDLDVVKKYATPRTPTLMTGARTARAQAMLASGATQAQVAAALGVSLTTLKNSLK